MPELPEIETLVQTFRPRVIGKKIQSIEILLPKSVRGDRHQFLAALTNHSFSQVTRKAKLVIFRLADSNDAIICHLRMTGQFVFERGGERVAAGHPWPPFDSPQPNKQTRLVLHFADSSVLFYNDLRQFGFWQLVSARELETMVNAYGIEPLTPDFTWERFCALFASSRAPIKSLLLDQSRIAGLGNIYADEVLWHARIHPATPVGKITESQQRALFTIIPQVLSDSIAKGGTTIEGAAPPADGKFHNYADFLAVYKQDGKPCRRCGTTILKIRAGGRGTHLCPECQKPLH